MSRRHRRTAAAQAMPPTAAGVTTVAPKASLHEAATTGTRRTIGWNPPTVGPNAATLWDLELLRARSRSAVRSNGYARGIIDKLVVNLVGAGIKPLSLATDKAFRAQLQALWLKWTDYSDADGTSDWYRQQEQAVRCWKEAGEVFLRLRSRRPEDGLPVPLQLQVLEPELCPHTYNGVSPVTGNRIRAGIEFDPIGRRAAYYFYAVRPGDLQDWDVTDLRRVPADGVLHLFKPLRPGSIRGLPHLTQALNGLRELDDFDDATLLRQKLANMLVAFLKPASPESDLNVLSGRSDATTQGNRETLGLEPGLFQTLDPGEEVDWSDPPDVIAGYVDFIRMHLRKACTAAGVPYETLTGDLSGVNDRSVRVILHEFRRSILCEQELLIFTVCRRVWEAFMDAVFLWGLLPIPSAYALDPEPWAKVEWRPHGWPYLHPVQDVEAQQAAIRAGFTSRAAVVSELGDDAEVVDQQQADDNERADSLALRYDSDARQPKSGGAPTNAPAPNPDEPPAGTAAKEPGAGGDA